MALDRMLVTATGELRRFVSAKVAKLSGDLQHPTVDRDNLTLKIAFPRIPEALGGKAQ